MRNKNLFLLILILTGFIFNSCSRSDMKKVQVNQPISTKGTIENETDRKVKEIMSKMTLLDKVGEMTQLSIDMVSVGNPYNLTSPHQLDEMKLKEVLVDYRVGSILNAGGHAYTRDHWYKIISRIQEVAMKDKPTGIPVLYGIDAIHGVNYTADGTLFPQQISLAATWDTLPFLKSEQILRRS